MTDVSKIKFFNAVRKAEKERLERHHSDPEFRKRFMLKCATGGAMRGHNKPAKITLPKLSFMEE